jgi:hypothetical protein
VPGYIFHTDHERISPIFNRYNIIIGVNSRVCQRRGTQAKKALDIRAVPFYTIAKAPARSDYQEKDEWDFTAITLNDLINGLNMYFCTVVQKIKGGCLL